VVVLEKIKNGVLKVLTTPIISRLFTPLIKNNAIIFYLHRFEDKNNGVRGHSIQCLEESLMYLQRAGYNFVSLSDIVSRFESDKRPLNKAVCFTMDDGYLDQATIAVPIFEKYNCPVTIFLITDFLDGKSWPWDDQVRYMFLETKLTSIEITVNQRLIKYDFTKQSRRLCAREFQELCKSQPEKKMLAAIDSLSVASGLKLSNIPPKSNQAITWDMARALEKRGVTFGCHSVGHKIFSQMTEERAKAEMTGSWERLEKELVSPLKVFCFPTGRYIQDFTIRDTNLLEKLGFIAALSTDPDYIRFNSKNNKIQKPILLNRFSFPNEKSDLIQSCTGIEQAKLQVREQIWKTINNKYGSKHGFIRHTSHRANYFFGRYREQVNIDWQKVSRLIFICSGNICRSPFAEIITKPINIDALSFGVNTTGGDAANSRAIEIAKEYGVDLSRHITSRIENYTPKNDDLIIAMEPVHLDIYSVKVSNEKNTQKTLLGLWGKVHQPYIHDPYSANDIYFRRCFSQIMSAIEIISMKLL